MGCFIYSKVVVGTGDIASVLIDKEDVIFFASGVSNSQEKEEKEFDREERLLLKQDWQKKLVYFSTLSIYYKDTPYTRHKRKMEAMVKNIFPKHCIVRIGNITWGQNPNTIINYFKRNPNAKVEDGYRFLVDKEEFLYWMNLIPNFNTEMNITGKLTPIKEIKTKYT